MDLTLGARRGCDLREPGSDISTAQESAAEEVQKGPRGTGEEAGKHQKERAKLQEEVEREEGPGVSIRGVGQEERRRQEAEARIADARRREEGR